MPGSNAGTGWPIHFYCAKCRKGRGWDGRQSNRRGWNVIRTGRTKPYRGGNRGVRGLATFHEYRCSDCKHVGWSRHVAMLDKPVEPPAFTAKEAQALSDAFEESYSVPPAGPPVALLRDIPGLSEAVERELLKKMISPVTTAENILDLVAAYAGPPVALRPAREVAHEVQNDWLNMNGGHADLLELITKAIEADRSQRDRSQVGLHPATVEACAVAAGMMAADLLERHNAARKAGATRETLIGLGSRWATAGDVAARIRSLTSQPGGSNG